MFPDLTQVVRNYFWQDWNDVISSIAQSRSTRLAFEHINQGGDSLLMPPGFGHGNLTDLGFNDRISSIVNFG